MSGLLSGGGGSTAPVLSQDTAEALQTYYKDAAPVRNIKQYLDGADKKKMFSDLLREQASNSHQQPGDTAELAPVAEDVPALPVQSSAHAAQPGEIGSAVRGAVRKGIINELIGSYLGG